MWVILTAAHAGIAHPVLPILAAAQPPPIAHGPVRGYVRHDMPATGKQPYGSADSDWFTDRNAQVERQATRKQDPQTTRSYRCHLG